MNSLDYIKNIEPFCISLFESLKIADIGFYDQYRIHEPAITHYKHILKESVFYGNEIDEKYNDFKINEAEQAIYLAKIAQAAISGSILQIAKTIICISTKSSKCPSPFGRKIKSMHITDIIWYTRNQALHFEDGFPTEKTFRFLEKISADHDFFDISNLDMNLRSLARDSLYILEWGKYEDFAIDMIDLLNSSR